MDWVACVGSTIRELSGNYPRFEDWAGSWPGWAGGAGWAGLGWLGRAGLAGLGGRDGLGGLAGQPELFGLGRAGLVQAGPGWALLGWRGLADDLCSSSIHPPKSKQIQC